MATKSTATSGSDVVVVHRSMVMIVMRIGVMMTTKSAATSGSGMVMIVVRIDVLMEGASTTAASSATLAFLAETGAKEKGLLPRI